MLLLKTLPLGSKEKGIKLWFGPEASRTIGNFMFCWSVVNQTLTSLPIVVANITWVIRNWKVFFPLWLVRLWQIKQYQHCTLLSQSSPWVIRQFVSIFSLSVVNQMRQHSNVWPQTSHWARPGFVCLYIVHLYKHIGSYILWFYSI